MLQATVPAMKSVCRHLNIKRYLHYVTLPIVRYSKYYRTLLVKLLAYGVVFGVFLWSPLILYGIYVHSVEMYFFQLQMDAGRDSYVSSVCLIPDYNPFDPSILPYIYPWNPVKCGERQAHLTYVDTDGFIRLNLSGVKTSGYNAKDYECMYAKIVRCNGTDDEVKLTAFKIFRDKEQLHHPFVIARCYLAATGKLVYEAGHAYIVPPSASLIERTKKVRNGRPNIVIVGIDSLSRLNFIRQLPKTYKFLMGELDSIVFSGLTKVGDNTYPNVLTMLTGLAARKKPGIDVPSWGESRANGNFDDLPIVWKQFTEEGYITMYAEDLPEFTAFNYLAKGFLQEPTDYYMRPFWLAMDAAQNMRSSDSRCYGLVPKYEYLFNYTEQFIMKMKKYPHFAFSFLTAYSHDYINSVQVIDDKLEEMFQNLYRRGDLENTIVIVMGDHGNRFDDIRQSVIGRIEERMPFFSVSLPRKLKEQYPHLEKNLQDNSRVLLSWYDVYELLMDVAKDNFKVESSVKKWGVLGYSMFRPVPNNRTCLQAGIPQEYCVCSREKSVSTDNLEVVEVARDLVNHVNRLLATPDGKSCVPLTLSQVTSAQLLLPNKQVSQPRGYVVTYRVSVKVAPSAGLLEGTVEKGAWDHMKKVVGEVNRINRYGNQSHCTRNKILKLYCYCADLTES